MNVDIMTEEDIILAANELKKTAIALIGSLIAWQFAPIVYNRNAAEKERINELRSCLQPFALPRYKKAMPSVIRDFYKEFKFISHDMASMGIPKKCPYSTKELLDTNYFPKVARANTKRPKMIIQAA